MMIMTDSGRAAQAAAIAAQPLHFAWGEGDPAWDSLSAPPTPALTALVAEVGRRLVVNPAFVVPDPAGEIVVPTGRFSQVADPSPHLFLRVAFDFSDDPSATLREIGIFVGGRPKPELPPGQRYFAPADIVQPGILLALERIPKFDRSPAVRQNFETVITV